MPIAEGAVGARVKKKFKEKHKMGPCIGFLACGLLLMLGSDVVFIMLNCIQEPPDSNCEAICGFGVESMSGAVAFSSQQDKCVIFDPPPDLHQRFELGYFDAKSNQDYGISTQNGYKLIGQELLHGNSWDGRGMDADPTRKKNVTAYEDLSVFISRILHDFALYKDPDAVEMLSSDDIAFNNKAMFDSVLFISSF